MKLFKLFQSYPIAGLVHKFRERRRFGDILEYRNQIVAEKAIYNNFTPTGIVWLESMKFPSLI